MTLFATAGAPSPRRTSGRSSAAHLGFLIAALAWFGTLVVPIVTFGFKSNFVVGSVMLLAVDAAAVGLIAWSLIGLIARSDVSMGQLVMASLLLGAVGLGWIDYFTGTYLFNDWFSQDLRPPETAALTLLLAAGVFVGGWAGRPWRRRAGAPAIPAVPLPDGLFVHWRFGVEQPPVPAAHLAAMVASGEVPSSSWVRRLEGGEPFPASELAPARSGKSYGVALTFAVLLGAFGAHWFYLGRPALGALRLTVWAALVVALLIGLGMPVADLIAYYQVMMGLSLALALWSLVDIVLVATRVVRDGQGRRLP